MARVKENVAKHERIIADQRSVMMDAYLELYKNTSSNAASLRAKERLRVWLTQAGLLNPNGSPRFE